MALSIKVRPWMLVVMWVVEVVLNGLAATVLSDGATSNAEYSFVQPDPSTFSVWIVIFILQAVFVVAQFVGDLADVPGIEEARAWQLGNFATNGLWLVLNGLGSRGFSWWLAVVDIALNLVCLVKLYTVLDVDYTRVDVSWKQKLAIYLSPSSNLPWVVLATLLNISNTLFDPTELDLVEAPIGGPDWAIAVVGLATVIAAFLALTRVDVVYVIITVWALSGIWRNQQPDTDAPWGAEGVSANLELMTIICMAALGAAALTGVVALITIMVRRGSSGERKDSDADRGTGAPVLA